MLTRLYVHNYKCLVNFEFRPKAFQLLLGSNGSGKSTVFEVLEALRLFAIEAAQLPPIPHTRTRWLNEPSQRFQLDVTAGGASFEYAVAAGTDHHGRLQIKEETLRCDGRMVIERDRINSAIINGGDRYPLDDPTLSALCSFWQCEPVPPFYHWLQGVRRPKLEAWSPSGIAERYPEFLRVNSAAKSILLASLRDMIPGLRSIEINPNDHQTVAGVNFEVPGHDDFIVALEELSDGQRALIALYIELHALQPGETLLLDEPDNFVALAEIQPWLLQLRSLAEDSGAQVLFISHHPELVNQLAADAVIFQRFDGGATRLAQFPDDTLGLEPAELVARGWESD